jgi:hypothetical protein
VTLTAHDERPVDSTANAICCGVACQFAIFHGDDLQGEPYSRKKITNRMSGCISRSTANRSILTALAFRHSLRAIWT